MKYESYTYLSCNFRCKVLNWFTKEAEKTASMTDSINMIV
jgi:phage FluMu protein Com